MYTLRRTNLKFKILFEEDPVTIALVRSNNISIFYIYFLKKKFTENVLQNTPSCTIDKKYGEYAPIPLNIVCAVIHDLLFLYKNEFLKKKISKIFSKTHQVAPF